MKNCKTYTLITILILLIQAPILAQHNYAGTIIDENTAEPLVGATISTNNKGVATTNYNGKFEFELEEASQNFTISYVGYELKTMASTELKGMLKLKPAASMLNQIVLSVNRDARERSEAPISIASISTQVIEDAKATRIDEVINKVSGVYMVDLGNEQHTMAIRQPINYKGLFLYLEDGLPIRPTGVFNHNALLEMNMAALRSIEVIRGPVSSTYGSEAIGGAINFISMRAAAAPRAKINIQANNNGYRRVDLNASNTFNKIGISVSGYYAQRKNGFLEHSDFDKLALTFRADYFINNKNTLTFDATYIDYEADMTGSLDSAFFYSKNYSSQQTFTNRAVDALRTKLVYNRYWNTESKTTVTACLRDNSIRQNPSYRVRDDYTPWGNPDGDQRLAHGEINDNSVNSFGVLAQHQQQFKALKNANLTVGASIDNSPNTFVANYIAITKSDENVYTNFTKTDSVLTDYEVSLINYALMPISILS